jgi:hypothetical protein
MIMRRTRHSALIPLTKVVELRLTLTPAAACVQGSVVAWRKCAGQGESGRQSGLKHGNRAPTQRERGREERAQRWSK